MKHSDTLRYYLFKINLLHIKTGGHLVGSSVIHNLFEKRKTCHLKFKKCLKIYIK